MKTKTPPSSDNKEENSYPWVTKYYRLNGNYTSLEM